MPEKVLASPAVVCSTKMLTVSKQLSSVPELFLWASLEQLVYSC